MVGKRGKAVVTVEDRNRREQGRKADYKRILRTQTASRARRMHAFYVMLLLSLGFLLVFKYLPMYGALIAFKDFKVPRGILRSPWNNFYHFETLFTDPFFYRILFNTVYLSLLRIIFAFPCPIVLAILINEVRCIPAKKSIQTISYLPNFISWVVLGGVLREVLSPQRGMLPFLFGLFNRTPPNLFTQSSTFRALLVSTGIWQGVGWGSIIYLAALTSIDPSLYESADIDGANRFQKITRITVPSLVPIITIMLILQVGRILNESFEQIFNLYNPLVYNVADVFETYVYRIGILESRFAYSTAVGLFKNVVGILLVLITNHVARRFTEYALW